MSKRRSLNISISMLSVILFIIAAVIMFFAVTKVRDVNRNIQRQAEIQSNQRECEAQGRALAAGSDFLTNEVWRFVATGDIGHMNHYWEEIRETKSRDEAINKLRSLSLSDEELELVEMSKNISDELVIGEKWAMRIAVEALDIDINTVPEEVAEVKLTSAELSLPKEEQHRLALGYIFGEEYKRSKTKILDSIDTFQKKLHIRKQAELDEAVNSTYSALKSAQLLNVTMLFILLLSMAAVYIMVTRPFKGYARALKEMEGKGFMPLEETGSKDTVRFAQVFNRIYDDWKKQKDKLEEEQRRFHVAVEDTAVIVYEYIPSADEYKAYGILDGEASRDTVPIERVIPDFMKAHAARAVGEDGVEVLKRIIDDGGGTYEMPFVFNGKSIWGRITATSVYDEDENVVKLIGKITNIESEREKELALEKMRSRDSLTGVYNKEAGIRKVQGYMEKKSCDEICGIMLLDMDDFKELNESEGETFGDAVLLEVADILKSMTGPDDIVTRLGGDEFMLFIKDCPKSRATILGPQIAEAIRNLSPNDNTELIISASIGMCVTEVVDDYSGLYRCAESTLKYVKSHIKGRAACYLDTSNEIGMMLTQAYPDRHTLTKIDRTVDTKENLVSFALDLLGKAKNLNDALFLLLSRMGKLYDLDRVSIIEVDSEYMICRITQQWTKNPADNQIGEIYYISEKELRSAAASYDLEGLSTEYLVESLKGIGSILHSAIWNRGIYEGVMSFERKEKDYVWTAEERQVLSELIKIISSFTLKARSDAVSQAKTEFLSRMSHEIRTPMNAITGMTSIAKSSLKNPKKTLDCLNKIEAANAYLLDLINDILDMSRIESGKIELNLEAVDLNKQLKELDIIIRQQAEEKGLSFSTENAYTGGNILADSLRLSQVLVNLLGNAVKFTNPGGKVSLKVTVENEYENETELKFCVSDTGIGISEEAQKRIFNAFEQGATNTAASYGGTGLGLAISSRLVQMMGGTLDVKSVLGKGSDFFFTLRFLHTDKECIENDNDGFDLTEVRHSFSGKRILVAEDNELNKEIAEEILVMNGFSVETADNGSKAVSMFESKPPNYYDAILMDIRMPIMDGFEATRRIRTMGKENSRSIPIIAMTANAFDEDMKKSLDSGMNGHLSKPIETEKLLKMLRRCILSK